MKFHTRTGTHMRLSEKEVKRQFNGLTIAVRPRWGKPVEGKRFRQIVSLVQVKDGHVSYQVLAESKHEAGLVCAHIMRWLDKCSHADFIKAASASRDRMTRKQDAALRVVKKDAWQLGRDREPETATHPCDAASPFECECEGACSCHWEQA